MKKGWRGFTRTMVEFSHLIFVQFANDRCNQKAAALTFTSLLALVPLLSVSFAIFSAFPAFGRLKGELNDFIFENFVPQVGMEVRQYLDQFTSQTGSLTAVGVVVLAFSAILLLNTITATFNDIWRADRRRGIGSRLLLYWALLTLPPLLFGASISLSSYLFTVVQLSGVEEVTGSVTRLAFVIPFFLQILGLAFLYVILPHKRVSSKDALIGATISSILLEILKKAFAWYLTSFPTYQTIYGALATVPIFLLWVYVSWNIVLAGAVITANLPDFRAGKRHGQKAVVSGFQRIDLMVTICLILSRGQKVGRGINFRDLQKGLGVTTAVLEELLDSLKAQSFVTRSDLQYWHLAQSASDIPVNKIVNAALFESKSPRKNSPISDELIGFQHSANQHLYITLDQLATRIGETSMAREHDGQINGDPPQHYYKKVISLVGLGALASQQ